MCQVRFTVGGRVRTARVRLGQGLGRIGKDAYFRLRGRIASGFGGGSLLFRVKGVVVQRKDFVSQLGSAGLGQAADKSIRLQTRAFDCRQED